MGERYRDRGEELMREAGIICSDSEERLDSGLLIDGYASPAESLVDRIRKQGKVCGLTFTHPHRSHQSGKTRLFDSMSKEGKK